MIPLKYCLGLIIGLSLIGCVQKTVKRTVHFSVDMRGVPDVNSVGIRGNSPPLSWEQDFNLTDEDGDSVYAANIVLDTPFDWVEIKFVKNNGEFELEGRDNRKVRFEQQEELNFHAVFNVE